MSKKYSILEKKKLMYQLKEINDKEIYQKIYDSIKNKVEMTINSNGVFFDFNKLNDDILDKIKKYILDYEFKKEEESIEYVKYSTEEFDKIDIKGNRLNNIEKHFLKLNKNKNKNKNKNINV